MHSHRYQISSSICFQSPKKTADVWSHLPTKRISSPSGQDVSPIKPAQRAKQFYSFKFFLEHQFPHKAFTLCCALCSRNTPILVNICISTQGVMSVGQTGSTTALHCAQVLLISHCTSMIHQSMMLRLHQTGNVHNILSILQ